jgi:ATP-dependent exoDNAse (exonuclease V) alpha subunit
VEDPLEEIAVTLNEEQRKAFFLVCDHRRRNQPESANKPSQLLLYLTGARGTGKSTVIKAICDYFERIDKRDTLLIFAYTGIAASNISGSTLHSVCGFGFGNDGKQTDRLSGAANGAAPKNLWSKIEYAIIDEISVIGQTMLARLHSRLNTIRAADHDEPFAGLNILFAGDFMQLPPVRDPSLYMPNKVARVASVSDNLSQQENRKNTSSSIGAGTVTNAIGRDLWLRSSMSSS